MSKAEKGTQVTFKARQFAAREDAILDAANGLLARKGYDLMSLDDIASEVGIAKGSLYKHFPSKEALAAGAMTRLLLRTLAHARSLDDREPAARLRSLLRWCLQERLAGGVPYLPATSPSLMAGLLANEGYVTAINAMNELLLGWIAQARTQGALRPEVRDEVVLFTIYARTCDPTLEFLRMASTLNDEGIVEAMLDTCFNGLAAASPAAA